MQLFARGGLSGSTDFAKVAGTDSAIPALAIAPVFSKSRRAISALRFEASWRSTVTYYRGCRQSVIAGADTGLGRKDYFPAWQPCTAASIQWHRREQNIGLVSSAESMPSKAQGRKPEQSVDELRLILLTRCDSPAATIGVGK
jgi:hypothetical protein